MFPPALVIALAGSVLAPRPLRLACRATVAAWLAAVAGASAQVAGEEGPAEAAGQAAVFATMHLSWGTGFLGGCLSFGPPLAALARIVGLRRGT